MVDWNGLFKWSMAF
jgi:hypothetical protein